MKPLIICLAICACVAGMLSCGNVSIRDTVFAPYRNNKVPMPFAPELTIKGNTYKGCFSDEYSIFYFFRHHVPNREDYRIYQSAFKDGQWNKPELINFSDSSSDLYPLISTLEKDKLFFISYRRTPGNTSRTVFEVAVSPDESYMILTIAENRQDARLFLSRKTQQVWTAPIYIGDIVKSDMTGNFPYITADGEFLIFTRHFDGFFILPAKAFLDKKN